MKNKAKYCKYARKQNATPVSCGGLIDEAGVEARVSGFSNALGCSSYRAWIMCTVGSVGSIPRSTIDRLLVDSRSKVSSR